MKETEEVVGAGEGQRKKRGEQQLVEGRRRRRSGRKRKRRFVGCGGGVWFTDWDGDGWGMVCELEGL